MTLDWDDVRIAKDYLASRDRWNDLEVIRDFEDRFSKWNGSSFAYSFMSGRVALSACIHALNLKAGDEVILPGYTCIVVPNAFHFQNIKVIYADIELETFGLDIDSVKQKTTSNTKAIVIQHLYGLVSRDYLSVLELARARGIRVLEDCAHATGAEFRGRKVGNLGDVAFYSSEQSKVFCTIQGGIAVSNDQKLATRLREYSERSPFPDKERTERLLKNVLLNFYQFKHPARWCLQDLALLRYSKSTLISTTAEEMEGRKPVHYGQRMPAPIAALGTNQLKKLDSYNALRRQTAYEWDRWCQHNNLSKPRVLEDSIPVYLRYPVLVNSARKMDTRWARKELGIELGVWFLSQLHPIPATIQGCPNAEIAVKQCVNFPCLRN